MIDGFTAVCAALLPPRLQGVIGFRKVWGVSVGKVVLTFSMSLDGFIAGPDVSMDHAMGVGGDRLHKWMFHGGPENAIDLGMARELLLKVGAVVLGRRTYDVGLQHWGDTPYPVPSFVVTHEKLDTLEMESAAFTFVNEGVGGSPEAGPGGGGRKSHHRDGRQCRAANAEGKARR